MSVDFNDLLLKIKSTTLVNGLAKIEDLSRSIYISLSLLTKIMETDPENLSESERRLKSNLSFIYEQAYKDYESLMGEIAEISAQCHTLCKCINNYENSALLQTPSLRSEILENSMKLSNLILKDYMEENQ